MAVKAKVIKFRDFDKMLDERRETAPRFKLFGKEYILTPSLRYDAVLALQALAKRSKEDNVSDDDAFKTFELILGKDNLEDLRMHDDFDVDMAADIVKWAMSMYGFGEENDEETPKVKMP